MEKDYFTDRPKECQQRVCFLIGNEAFICLKAAQKIAVKLSDLTRIKITGILTSQTNHPRGIKLRGMTFERDLLGNITADQELLPIRSEAVGRCTYPIINNKVLTVSGLKSIVFSDKDGLSLLPSEEIGDKYNLSVTFKTRFMQFECVLNPYCYYSVDKLSCVIKHFQLEDSVTDGKFLYTYYNSVPIAVPVCNVLFSSPRISSISAVFEAENPDFSRFIDAVPVSYCGVRE